MRDEYTEYETRREQKMRGGGLLASCPALVGVLAALLLMVAMLMPGPALGEEPAQGVTAGEAGSPQAGQDAPGDDGPSGDVPGLEEGSGSQGQQTPGEGETPTDKAEVSWLFVKMDDSGNPLAGARMELRDATGTVLRTFETTDEGLEVTEALAVGETYTLHEASAPAGFALADDIAFGVWLGEDGAVRLVEAGGGEAAAKEDGVFLMTDLPLAPLAIEKRDEAGRPLAGAKLRLWDKTADVLVGEWTSAGEAHQVAAELLHAGHEYQLTEAEAPEGYEAAGEVSFALDRDGKVAGFKGDGATYDEASRAILLANEPTPEPEDPEDPQPKTPDDPEEPADQEPVVPTRPTTPESPVAPKPSGRVNDSASAKSPAGTPKAPTAWNPSAQEPIAPAAQPSVAGSTATGTDTTSPTVAPSASNGLPQTGDDGSPLTFVLVACGAILTVVGLAVHHKTHGNLG